MSVGLSVCRPVREIENCYNIGFLARTKLHGRSYLRDRGGASPPWRTKILILPLFWRNKLGFGGAGPLNSRPPERGGHIRLWSIHIYIYSKRLISSKKNKKKKKSKEEQEIKKKEIKKQKID